MQSWWIICWILYDLPLQCISGHPTSHQYYFLVEVFLKGNVCGEIFFIVFKICQAGWFIWRASTNPQIWQLFLQATSQVMTAHNLFAPSHSVVLPFGFILKLIPDANLAVQLHSITPWQDDHHVLPMHYWLMPRLGSIWFRWDFVLKSLILSATKYFRLKYQPCPSFYPRQNV